MQISKKYMGLRRFFMHRQKKKAFLLILMLLEMLSNMEATQKQRILWWVHPMNQNCGKGLRGEFHSQVQDLKKYPNHFYQYFHMSKERFTDLLDSISNKIMKQNTNWHPSITAEERLAVCPWYVNKDFLLFMP